MRILIISNLLPPHYLGGYEIACSEVAGELFKRGHDVRVLSGDSHIPGSPDPDYVNRCLDFRAFNPYPQAEGVTSYYGFESTCSNLGNTSRVRAFLHEFDPDVVYCWNLEGAGGLAILDFLNSIDVPWVIHLMDNVPAFLIDRTPTVARLVFNRSANDCFKKGKAIAMSRKLLADIFSATGVKFEGEVEIVPGWVNSTDMPIRSVYNEDGCTRFVNAGAIQAHKGVDLILEAAAQLISEGAPEFSIDFYGDGSVDHYVSVANALGLSKAVRFCGGLAKPELLKQLHAYDSFLFPTWDKEAFGFGPIEAAAAGCVPILTRTCGASEQLTDSLHCIKIDRNTGALADAMRSVICKRVNLTEMGQAAAVHVRSELSLNRCIDAIEHVLQNENRCWDRSLLNDPKLPLLLYAKHHLAQHLLFGPGSEQFLAWQRLVEERDGYWAQKNLLAQERDALVQETLRLRESLSYLSMQHNKLLNLLTSFAGTLNGICAKYLHSRKESKVSSKSKGLNQETTAAATAARL